MEAEQRLSRVVMYTCSVCKKQMKGSEAWITEESNSEDRTILCDECYEKEEK